MTLPGNPNLNVTVTIARQLGVTVEVRRGTGELKFTHPAFGRTYLANGRRKDTPRHLLVALRRLAGG